MGIFGKSLEEKTQEAVAQIGQMGLGVVNLTATVNGEVITLRGEAPDIEAKTRAMQEFCARVECDNVINTIRVPPPAAHVPAEAGPVPAAGEEPVIHVVAPGDTLGALAKRYYGKAGAYMKIFEANRDILSDPNLIKVGQRLRIPS
ncbi:MAG TPA: LysM peptidoglycan-binding domain-containing protein [Thermoanaerobaculaceae bacterium]|mgnify:CR=1 FL=1|nr:LysM peptidoglycan-binding domain-containing protein [Thermoanaerobaculaceae bacterium]HPS76831.1 LysM peptidoglycan-binding domain-containing protein [Thermoanaerobaculaceae bacterium]